jgi:hypothetical protein
MVTRSTGTLARNPLRLSWSAALKIKAKRAGPSVPPYSNFIVRIVPRDKWGLELGNPERATGALALNP